VSVPQVRESLESAGMRDCPARMPGDSIHGTDSGGATCGRPENRPKYDRKGLRYPCDLSDAEWDLVNC
jgi:hypothetical protein